MNGFEIVGTQASLASDAEGWSSVTVNFRDGRKQRIRSDASRFAKYTDFAHPLIENFVACIQGTAQPTVSGRSVLPTIQLLEQAYEEAGHYTMPWNEHWESCHV